MDFDAVAGFPAEELLSQRGFGGDYEHFRSVMVGLQATACRAQKIKGACAVGFEFHQGREIDGGGFLELREFERLVNSQGLFGFGGEPSLGTCQVSGLQPARIVLVLGLALFVRGVGMHGPRGSGQRGQLLGELLDNLPDDNAF